MKSSALLLMVPICLAGSPARGEQPDARRAPTTTTAPTTASTARVSPPPATTASTIQESDAATSAKPAATADELPARTEARDRFAAGLKLYEEGDFSLALIEFERAYSLIPDHRVLYNIGQVSIQLGRYARAARTLKQYLTEGGDQVPPDRKNSVANDLAMLASRTAHLRVNVNQNDAEILLDNDVVASSPMHDAVLVDAGEHRLTVRKPGFVTSARPLALAGRDNVTLDVTLAAEPKAQSTEKTVIVEKKVAPTEKTSSRGLYLALGWSTTALLGAGWATTGYFGYRSAQEREDLLAQKTTGTKLDDAESRTKRWYLAADVLGATTVLSAGAMLYYTLTSTDGRESRQEKRSTHSRRTQPGQWGISAGPRSVMVSGQF